MEDLDNISSLLSQDFSCLFLLICSLLWWCNFVQVSLNVCLIRDVFKNWLTGWGLGGSNEGHLFLHPMFPNWSLVVLPTPEGDTRGTSSATDRYFCSVDHILKQDGYFSGVGGAWWGHLREPTRLPGAGVLSQVPSKAQAPNAFQLMVWSSGPKKKSALLFWRCPPWLSGIWFIFISNTFKDISSKAKALNGIQITSVLSLIARNSTWEYF